MTKDLSNSALACNMKILLAEYAVGTGLEGSLLVEGRAMLRALTDSFSRLGHNVIYLTAGSKLSNGKGVLSSEKTFEQRLEMVARECDAGLVIGPDDILGKLTDIVEKNTVNLGCTAESVKTCADKLLCTNMLTHENIDVPAIATSDFNGRVVIKPRFGCASEGVRMMEHAIKDLPLYETENYIATEYIEGEQLSVSLVCGKRTVVLSLNKQLIDITDRNGDILFDYIGNKVPYKAEYEDEIFQVAKRTAEILGCNGYVGIDVVYSDRPYVIDVNPRPTTAIFGLVRTLKCEIAELLLMNIFGELPVSVCLEGECTFTKDDIEDII